jgi:hypothetical protein
VNWNALDDASGLATTIIPFDGRNWEQAAATLGQASPKA